MSRVGKNPVVIPSGVNVEVAGQTLKAKGPKGELSMKIHDDVCVAVEDDEGKKVVRLKPRHEGGQARKIWPTMRALVSCMMVGVHSGYKKDLEIQGVGLRVNLQGKTLVMQMGYSHEIKFSIPDGIQLTVADQTKISIVGIDKQKVGQVAAEIRGFRPPEPYKGKGIRYAKEYVPLKEGKKK